MKRTRIMYIECKADGLEGRARIARVSYSNSGKMIYYGGKRFESLKGGYKANYRDVDSGEEYWISGPRRDGLDRLYERGQPVAIEEDVREEYWREIRGKPERVNEKFT